MPYMTDDARRAVDLSELGGPKRGGSTLVPGLSRGTIRRLTRAERWPEPRQLRPCVSWWLEDVAAAMRDLGIPIPRAWGLPERGEGGLDLSQWATGLPAEPLRLGAILARWEKDGGAELSRADLGRGLAVLCGVGAPISRWRSDGGWLYCRGVRPAAGRHAARRRGGMW